MKGILSWTIGSSILVTLCPKDTFSQSGAPVRVLVNQQATLFGNVSRCENAQFRRILPIEATIAMCQKHKCAIKEGFLEKVKLKDNHLVLKSAKYTDWGTYECDCNGIFTVVKWDVVVALDVSVKELENITLLCFAKDVTWFHNDARILQSKIEGSTVIDKGFQNRVSLKEGAFKDGDLSLTLLDVSEKDVGLYLCRINDETAEGYPYAQMLHVNDNHPSPEGHQPDFKMAINSATTIIIIFALIIVVLSVKLYKVNRIISQSTSRTSHPREESQRNPSENVHMLAVPVDESQSEQTVAQPVQESETDPKSSSTQPFWSNRSSQ